MPNPPRRKRLSMTSLIDVIFLLLLFFMLSSTFSRFGEIELVTGGTGAGTSLAGMVFLRLGGEGLSLNGDPVTAADLASRVAALDRPAPHLVLSVTTGATAQALADVMVEVRGLAGTRLTVVR